MNKPLRKCTVCGLEAHNEQELELFAKAKKSRYGRNNLCKKCKNIYQNRLKASKRVKPTYLRKCPHCGVEAHNKDELELFVKVDRQPYGRSTICKKCCKEKSRKQYDSSRRKRLRHCYYSMLQRCYDDRDKNYKHYGGRGITVCDEWHNDKEAFIKWAIEKGYKRGLCIDRRDNNGNYSPDNCRWVTPSESLYNTRLKVTFRDTKQRICYKCKRRLPFNQFYKDSHEPTGIRRICIDCQKEIRKKRWAMRKT